MKKILLFIFCCTFSFPAFSKNIFDSSSPSYGQSAPSHNCWTASTGYFEGNFLALNHYIGTFGTNPGFGLFFQTVGINRNVPIEGSSGSGTATINLEMLIPQHVNEGDSFKLKMSGWHLMTSFFAYNFFPANDKLAIEVAPGMDWGQLYLSKKVLNAANIYKNIFIAPLARAEVRVVLPPFCFGVRALYRYDITNPDWKLKKAFPTVFGASRIYGFGFQMFVGYGKITR